MNFIATSSMGSQLTADKKHQVMPPAKISLNDCCELSKRQLTIDQVELSVDLERKCWFVRRLVAELVLY